LKICSVCNKISGTDEDHLDCQEKRRVMAKNANDLNPEIKALLDHMSKEKEKK